MTKNDDETTQTGTVVFKTVKAGCGFRFDPDTLNDDAGFDFSQAEQLANEQDSTLDDTVKTSTNHSQPE
jgi:hypothetical protein